MTEPAYCIGVDFGTESGRVLVLDARSGDELGVSVVPYPSGVIDRELPSTGEALPGDWALQDPDDWVKVLGDGIPEAVQSAGIDPAEVVGLGVDVTSCTVLPVTADGTPLCRLDEFRDRRHAWPKLWKHHAAQPVADRLNEVALERDEPFLERYGGRISSEWYFPKLIELWSEDREIYDAAAAFIEATDWIVWHLTGAECRQSATAGYKAMWSPSEGLPPAEYFEAAYPGFSSPAEKLGTDFVPLGQPRGNAHRGARQDARPRRERGHRRRQRRCVGVCARRRRDEPVDVRDRDRHLHLQHGGEPRRDPDAGDHWCRAGRHPAGAIRLRGWAGGGRRHAGLVRSHPRR